MNINNGVQVSTNLCVFGRSPIVLLGPNGSGKTTLANSIMQWNDADMISALRNIELAQNVQMLTQEQADQELKRYFSNKRSKPWAISSEINQLFSKLIAEDASAAIKERNLRHQGKEYTPEKTKIMHIAEIWGNIFPGREINFEAYNPKVKSNHLKRDSEYSAHKMSDGERVALYLAARVLDSDKSIIIIDEPEVHFHSLLASRFWDALENFKKDTIFLYVTHDLSFALSRRKASYLITSAENEPSLVELERGIPNQIAESLLAAASFSVYAKRIVFCEGEDGSSHDKKFFDSWFNDVETAVLPVGSCREVINSTSAYSNNKLVSGVNAIGIIDSDYHPKNYLNALPSNVHILPVHEIESLFCVEGVFKAISEHLGQKNGNKIYGEFISSAKQMFKSDLLNKQISERFKRRCRHEIDKSIHKIEITKDITQTKLNHVKGFNITEWSLSPDAIFEEEKKTIENALMSKNEDFIKYLPGKTYVNIAAQKLGQTKDAYIDLICNALAENDEQEVLYALGKKIETALEEYLPTRNLSKKFDATLSKAA